MRRLLLCLVLLLISACSQVPAPTTLSAGCANINDPFYDSRYQSGNVYFSPFRAGESVTVALEPTQSAEVGSLWLIVTDATSTPKQDIATWRAESDATLVYTFAEDMAEAEVFWAVEAGAPGWTVSCGM